MKQALNSAVGIALVALQVGCALSTLGGYVPFMDAESEPDILEGDAVTPDEAGEEIAMPCMRSEDCDDNDPCSGVEICNMSTGFCLPGVWQADGTLCQEDPRKICVGGSCKASACGDGYVDGAAGEVCEGVGRADCITPCGTIGTSGCMNCMWGECQLPAETCDGQDDDCDSQCDEDFGCCQGAEETCTTACDSPGTRVCQPGCSWGPCSGGGEVCNGYDDDCDGQCDNGFECCAGGTGESAYAFCRFPSTCSGGCHWQPDAVVPPSNDRCSGAIPLSCPGSVSGSDCFATNDYSPLRCGGGCDLASPWAREVVYELIMGSSGGRVVLETAGSEEDTILYVRGGECDSSNEVGCDDDVSGSDRSSRVVLNLSMGAYYVFVDSCVYGPYDNDLGGFVLSCDFI